MTSATEKILESIIPGKEYCISINGEKAVNNAKSLIGSRCYSRLSIHGEFAAQIEVVIDEPGTYNGRPNKWVDFSFIPAEMVTNVISWLERNGYSDCFAIIMEEDNETESKLKFYIDKQEETEDMKMEDCLGYRIIMRKETYTRTESGKSWKTAPDTVETETVSKEFYDNYIGSCKFFNNFGYGASCRKYSGYTYIGYIPVNVVTVSPYREKKIVTWFRFSPTNLH